MSDHQVDVYVFDDYRKSISPERLRKVAEASLEMESPNYPLAMDISLTDDETVRRLNKEYRGLDENTDVLSFSFISQGQYYGDSKPPSSLEKETPFISPPGQGNRIGEVIISYDQAKRQAQGFNRTVGQEIDFLIVHGVLHLLGQDHMRPQEEAVMTEKQNRIMATLSE